MSLNLKAQQRTSSVSRRQDRAADFVKLVVYPQLKFQASKLSRRKLRWWPGVTMKATSHFFGLLALVVLHKFYGHYCASDAPNDLVRTPLHVSRISR